MPESQFNYLFTLKNAHLGPNSYNVYLWTAALADQTQQALTAN